MWKGQTLICRVLHWLEGPGQREGNCQGGRVIARKRVGSIATACKKTQIGPNYNSSIDFVNLSNFNSLPLMTINITTKDQAAITTLIDSVASTNFLSPAVIEKFWIPTIAPEQSHTVTMLDRSTPKTGKT
jgi:hypothetical protein